MRIYKKYDSNKTEILKRIILQMYKWALKLSIAKKLHKKDPTDIEQAFKITKKIKREENFLNDKMEKNPKKKQDKDEIEELIRKIEKLSINLI